MLMMFLRISTIHFLFGIHVLHAVHDQLEYFEFGQTRRNFICHTIHLLEAPSL